MAKLQTLNITLEEGKSLVGVRTDGNVVTIVYEDKCEYRPIGFLQYGDIDDEDYEDDVDNTRN